MTYSENCAVYEITPKNGGGASEDTESAACWIIKATRPQTHACTHAPTSTHTHSHTHTHSLSLSLSEYEILTAFPRQQLFRKSASVLRYINSFFLPRGSDAIQSGKMLLIYRINWDTFTPKYVASFPPKILKICSRLHIVNFQNKITFIFKVVNLLSMFYSKAFQVLKTKFIKVHSISPQDRMQL